MISYLRYILCLSLVIMSLSASAKGYEITLELTNYDSNQNVCLGYYYGIRYNLIDTLTWQAGQPLTFKADSLLPEGAYLFFLQKGQKTINFVLPEKDQRLCLKADAKDLSVKNIKVSRSKDNKHFYKYLRFVSAQRPKINRLRTGMKDTTELARLKLQLQLEKVYEDIADYQRKFIKKYPKSITAFLISLDLNPTVPGFTGEPQEVLRKKGRWQRQHYFDNVDIEDPRLLRTTMFMRKINTYVNQLTPQHPDSVSQAVDRVLKLIEGQPELFAYAANFLLRSFDRPRVIGMDAVYVDMIENYVSTGKLPGKTDEEIKKLEADARRRKPVLIGKQAPNITLQQRDGKPFTLYDVQSDYTVLFIWRPNCGYCKKATPFIVAFHEKFKDKGVTVIGACTLTGDKTDQCWDYVDDKELPFINLTDKTYRSRFMHRYNAQRTPKIFILGKDKEILVKDFKGQQLQMVFERLLQQGGKWF